MSFKVISPSFNSSTNENLKAGQFEKRLDALLADLQKSVPNHQNTPSVVRPVQTNVDQENYYGTTVYGSLKGSTQLQTANYVSNELKASSFSQSQNRSMGRVTPSQQFPCRSQAMQTPINDHNSSILLPQTQMINNSNSMSELDSLLQDLSSARFNSFEKKKDYALPIASNSKSSSFKNVGGVLVEGRPTVESLLEEMDNASIYAVPNESPHKSPTPGRHVTITVRETKTEKLTALNDTGDKNIIEETVKFTHKAPNLYASSATKELDDLMASLSDIKVNNGSHHHQTVTDYAKPNKGISHLTKTITEAFVEDTGIDQLDSMLGSLQANMSRQGVNTVQKGCCNACEKPIVGQVITALGKTWHPEHFTCNHCNQELGTRNFFERDGFPYCEPDYHNLFSPRCAYCNGAILDKCVTALDKTWHTEHFFCAQCGQQFGEDGFHERDGKPYCRNDYFEMFAPKCNGCNRAIMENYISALNSQWHPDCFVCRDCRQPFHGGSFFDHEGLPYCELHYHAKRGSLCAGCSKPITGRCITAMFKKFHPEHFVCAFCLKQLNKGTFKEQNDKPYCHICFEKIFG